MRLKNLTSLRSFIQFKGSTLLFSVFASVSAAILRNEGEDCFRSAAMTTERRHQLVVSELRSLVSSGVRLCFGIKKCYRRVSTRNPPPAPASGGKTLQIANSSSSLLFPVFASASAAILRYDEEDCFRSVVMTTERRHQLVVSELRSLVSSGVRLCFGIKKCYRRVSTRNPPPAPASGGKTLQIANSSILLFSVFASVNAAILRYDEEDCFRSVAMTTERWDVEPLRS